METPCHDDPVAALKQLTLDQVHQRLVALTDEEQLLRHILRAFREREQVHRIREHMHQPGGQGHSASAQDCVQKPVRLQIRVALPVGPGEWAQAEGAEIAVWWEDSGHVAKSK